MAESPVPKPIAPSLSQIPKATAAPTLTNITPKASTFKAPPTLKVVKEKQPGMLEKIKGDLGYHMMFNAAGPFVKRALDNQSGKLTGRPKLEIKATQAAIEGAPEGAIRFFGGIGIDIGEMLLQSATFHKYRAPEFGNTTIGHAGKSFAQTAQFWKLLPKYKKALDNNEPIIPHLLEDAGNVAIASGWLKAVSKGIAAGAEIGSLEARAAAEASIERYVNSGVPQDFAAYQAYIDEAAKAANKAEMLSRKASRFNKISEAAGYVKHYGDQAMMAPLQPWIIGGKQLGAAIREGVYVEGIIGWGRKASEGYKAEIDQLIAENPDIDIKDRRLVDLQKKLSSASRLAMSNSVRAFIRQAVRNVNHDQALIERALIDIQENPEFKEDINPDTNKKWGKLSQEEQQAIIATTNGRAQLIKWLVENLDMSPEEAAVLGRYDGSPEYHLSPRGARLAYELLTPANGALSEVQYQRLSVALEKLTRASAESFQLAVNGFGRRHRLSPEYGIPLPFADKLGKNVMKYGSEELKAFWNQAVENGILELDINHPKRQEFIQAVVEQLPDEVALDSSMYPAQMRENIEFYKRVRRAYNRKIYGEATGEPIPPYDGGPRNPEGFNMTTKGGKLNAVQDLISTTKNKIQKLQDKILEITDKIAIKEVEHQKLAEKIKKYNIVDEYISGKSIKSIARRNYMSVAEVTEIINNNPAGKLFNKAAEIEVKREELRKAIGVKRASLKPDEFDAELAAMEETLATYETEAAQAKLKIDAARGLNEIAKLSDNATLDKIVEEISKLEDDVFDAEVAYEAVDGNPLSLWRKADPTDEQISVVTASMGRAAIDSINTLIDERLMNIEGLDHDVLQRTKQVLESAWSKAENNYLDANNQQLAAAAHQRLIQVSTYLNAVVEKINDVTLNPGDMPIDQATAKIIYDIVTNKTDQAILSGTAPLDMPIRVGTPGATPTQRGGRLAFGDDVWDSADIPRYGDGTIVFSRPFRNTDGLLSTNKQTVAFMKALTDSFADPSGIYNPGIYTSLGDMGRLAEGASQLIRWINEVRSAKGKDRINKILYPPDYLSPELYKKITQGMSRENLGRFSVTDPSHPLTKFNNRVREVLVDVLQTMEEIDRQAQGFSTNTQVNWRKVDGVVIRDPSGNYNTRNVRINIKGTGGVTTPHLSFDFHTPLESVLEALDALEIAIQNDTGVYAMVSEILGEENVKSGFVVDITGLPKGKIKDKAGVLANLTKLRSELQKLQPLKDPVTVIPFTERYEFLPGVKQKPPLPSYMDFPLDKIEFMRVMREQYLQSEETINTTSPGTVMHDMAKIMMKNEEAALQAMVGLEKNGYLDVTNMSKDDLDFFIQSIIKFAQKNGIEVRDFNDFINYQYKNKVVITPASREVMAPDIPAALDVPQQLLPPTQLSAPATVKNPAFVDLPIDFDRFVTLVNRTQEQALDILRNYRGKVSQEVIQLANKSTKYTKSLIEVLDNYRETGYFDVTVMTQEAFDYLIEVFTTAQKLKTSFPGLDVTKFVDFLKNQYESKTVIRPEIDLPQSVPVVKNLQPVRNKIINGKKVDYVVIPCGAEKLTTSSKAADMYTGSMFKDALNTARGVVPDEQIFILSAKYGLLRLDQVIEPYDIKFGTKGTIAPDSVAGQISQLISADAHILSLLPAEYHKVLAGGAGDYATLDRAFEGTKGIGQQKSKLKNIREQAAEEGNITPDSVIDAQLSGDRELPDNPELVQFERNLVDPDVRRVAYDVDVVDAMAKDAAKKMRKAERASDRLKAFQEFMDLSKQYDETVAAMYEKQKVHQRARLRLAKNEERQTRLRQRRDKLKKELKGLSKIVNSAEQNALLTPLQNMQGAVPLQVARGGGFPAELYSVSVPEIGDRAAYEQPLQGPMYLPTGRPTSFTGGMKMEIAREGLDGWRKSSSEHYRDGDRHTIFSLRLIAKRMGSDMARFTRNERFQAIVAQFGSKVGEIIGEERSQELYQNAYDAASNMPVQEQIDMMYKAGAELSELIDGIAAYSEGVPNPKAVFDLAVKQIYGELLAREMSLRGLSPIDPFKDISSVVPYRSIHPETVFVPDYFREHVARIETVQSANSFSAAVRAMHKVTRTFKTGTLVLSVTWQLGDLISNMIISHMSGVKVPDMIRRMREVKAAEYGTGKQGILTMLDPATEMPTPTPLGRMMQESPVQDISMAVEERNIREGIPQVEEKTPLLNRVSKGVFGKEISYPEAVRGRSVPKVSFKINETINRIQRHAYFLELLDRRLKEVGKDLDTVVSDGSWRNDPVTKNLVYDVAETANKWLGDFSDLSMAERKYVTAVVPFWAWIKHVHKVFWALGTEHPLSLAWYIRIGAINYDPNEDPMGLRYGGTSLFGGTVSTNFLNPLGDVAKGPVGAFLIDQDISPALNIQGPSTRLLGGAFGFDVTKGRKLTRPAGTANYTRSGQEQITPLIFPNRWAEAAGFVAQQFPIVQRIQNVLPGDNIPFTNIALGPVTRYQTGEARLNPVTGQRIEKWGGRPAALGRLFNIPGIPGQTDQQVADIQRAAVMRLRTIQALKFRRAQEQK